MTRLLDSDAYFVKCVKPNDEKLSQKFDSPFVMKQLTASGVLESVKIHASGYEYRESIESFVNKYWPISLQKTTEDSQLKENREVPGLENYVKKIFRAVSKDD